MTERSVLTSMSRAATALHSLSAIGVRVSIDNLGTGFASLSDLGSLPVNEIKVDQNFVRTTLVDREDEAVVRSVITLGQGLGLNVVTEGVENEHVCTTRHRLGCDLVQGYHLTRPMPIGTVPAVLPKASPEPTLTRGSF